MNKISSWLLIGLMSVGVSGLAGEPIEDGPPAVVDSKLTPIVDELGPDGTPGGVPVGFVVQNKLLLENGQSTTADCVYVDGTCQASPFSGNAVPCTSHPVAAVDGIYYDGRSYYFACWSDGGSISHNILLFGYPLEWTAFFKKSPVLQGTQDECGEIHLNWSWLPIDRPPCQIVFKLYRFGEQTPIWEGSANTFSEDGVRWYPGAPTYAGVYYLETWVLAGTQWRVFGPTNVKVGWYQGPPPQHLCPRHLDRLD